MIAADDFVDLGGFRQHLAAVAGVLHETVLALVAPHHDMGDDVDPQPRLVAMADAAIEQFDVHRNFGEQRIERLVEHLKTRQLGVAQFDDDAGALRGLDPRLPDRLLQRGRLGLVRQPRRLFECVPTWTRNLSAPSNLGQKNDCFQSICVTALWA